MDFREFSKQYNDYLMHYGVKGMKWHDHVYKDQDVNSNDRKDKKRRGPQWEYVGPDPDSEKIKVSDQNEAAVKWIDMYRGFGYTDDEIRKMFLDIANKPDQTPLGKKNYTFYARMIDKVPRKK